MIVQRQGSSAAPRELRGPLSDFRIGLPQTDGIGAFKIEDTWVQVSLGQYPHGRPVDASINDNPLNVIHSSKVLEAISNARSDVIVCIRDSKRGLPELEWLLSPHGNLIPPTRRDLRKKGGKIVLRWMPWMLPSAAGVAWSAFNLMQGFGYVVLLALAAMPLLFCGVCTYFGLALLVCSCCSRVQRLSEVALHARLAQSTSERSAGAQQSSLGTLSNKGPISASGANFNHRLLISDEQGLPNLRRLSGNASDVEMHTARAGGSVQWMSGSTMVSSSSRIDFRCYRFKLQGQSYTLFASRNFGGGRIFLAENDRVDVIVADDEQRKSGLPQFVWAMRNMEDGQVYACHRIMAPVANSLVRPLIGAFRMTQVTSAFRRSLRIWMTAIWVGVMLFGGVIYAAGDESDWAFFIIAAFGLPVIWLTCAEVPMSLWNLKWRKGHPSKRQRLTERVYALLDAGSPLDPSPTLIDV